MTAEHHSEIRMKDLVSYFTRRWKSILAVTAICTVILGGWQYLSVKKVHDAGEQTREEARYAGELSAYETNLENARKEVDFLNGVLEGRTAYRDHSLLMNLDPENVWAAEKKYLISEISEGTADVLAVYTGAMAANHEEAALAEAFGTENAGYAREVVSIAADPTENSFMVTVWASGKEKAEARLAYVSEKIAETGKKAQEIGSHTLRVLTEGVSKSRMENLETRKRETGEAIAKDEETLTNAKRALNNVLESKPFKPGNPVVRWAVTGGVLGFLLMIAIYLTTFLRKKER